MTSHSIKFIVSIFATAVMARLLTPQDYGLIGMVAILTNFVTMYKDMGLSMATIQRPEISYEQISTLFWVNVALSFAIMLFTAMLAPAVAWFYGEPRLTWITVVTGVGFIFGGLTVQHEALLRRQMRFLALALISFISMMVGYALGITMAWLGFSYWALVSSQLAVVITSTAAIWAVCRWRPGLPHWDSGVRSMIHFGGNFTGFTTINYFSRNLDNLLIGRFWGAQQLGLYAKAYQLMTLPIDQINDPVTSVAIPALSRLTDSPQRYRQGYLRMLEKIAMLTMPAVALMIATSDWIILVVLGPQWREASRIFLVLGITGLFQPIANTTGWLFLTQGRSRQMLKFGLISGPITMAAIVLGLRWGALGVATSYAIARVCIVDPFLYWFVGREGPVRTWDFYRTMTPFTCASLCALAVSLAFRKWSGVGNPLVGIGACLVITFVVTLIVLTLMPAGRLALVDLKTSLFLLVRKKQPSLAES